MTVYMIFILLNLLSINGLAGKITIFNERFSTNADRVVCVPENGIDIHYVMFVAESILRNKNKGRKGDLGKNEFTKLTPDMIKSTKIPIPMTKDHKFDLEKQIELPACVTSCLHMQFYGTLCKHPKRHLQRSKCLKPHYHNLILKDLHSEGIVLSQHM